jgi:hypothetical protein
MLDTTEDPAYRALRPVSAAQDRNASFIRDEGIRSGQSSE